MPTVQTPRMRIASEKYAKNINKRGQVSVKADKRDEELPVNNFWLSMFLFVVVGSAIAGPLFYVFFSGANKLSA